MKKLFVVFAHLLSAFATVLKKEAKARRCVQTLDLATTAVGSKRAEKYGVIIWRSTAAVQA
jgi:hypothetical protein